MKNVKTGFVLAILAGFGLVWGEAVPCTDDPNKLCAELDIIVRDFPVTHSDFENFQEEYFTSNTNAGKCAWDPKNNPHDCKDIVGATSTWIASFTSVDPLWQGRRGDYDTWGCGNTQTPQYGMHIGTDGYAKFDNTRGILSGLPAYLQKPSQAGYAWYGEFEDCQYDAKLNPKGLKTMRGFVHELCVSEARTSSWTLDMIDYSGNQNTKAKFHDRYNNKDKGPCEGGYVCKAHSWSQAVSITHNMVSPYLTFDPNLGEDMMYEPVISRSPTRPAACDNANFEQWYADKDVNGNSLEAAGINKRINTVLQLPKVDGTTNVYEIDYNRNNGGYFPLDMVDPTSGLRVCDVGSGACYFPTGTENQFGPQSLSIFCPPYDYAYRSSQTDYEGNSTAQLCEAWKRYGGPKNESAALLASQELNTYKYLRNYGFTMMGYAKFKYKKGGNEIFEFAGDDDMWIYVDGVLAVDLGGTHLAAPGKVEMDTLSKYSHGCHLDLGEPLSTYTASGENCYLDADGSWKDGSWHHLHFFYADRQTDGSNMKIHSTLSELAKSRYGQPAIASVLVTMEDDGSQKIMMNLNTMLDDNTVNMLKTKNEPAILVMRNENGKQVVYGFYVTDVVFGNNEGASGVQYEFSGELRDASGAVVTTGIVAKDKIAFNYEYDPELFGPGKSDPNYTDDVWSQLGAWGLKMSYTITSTSGKGVAGPPNELDEWADAVLRTNPKITTYVPDKFVDGPDFTSQSTLLTEKASSNGGKLPLNATADLQFVPIPADCGSETCGNGGNPMNLRDEFKAEFTASFVPGASKVLADAGVTPVTFVGDKNSGAAGLCKGNGNGAGETCFSVAYPVAGPFRLNIRVFDHLGHFVSQYQQVVTIDMLAEALGGKNTSVSGVEDGCQNPLYGETGAAWVSAKIYPVSQNGRMLATGPYIYQVAFVQEAYNTCLLVTGKPQGIPLDYTRSNVTYRVGFRRDKKK